MAKKKSTIDELEAILNSEDSTPVTILPSRKIEEIGKAQGHEAELKALQADNESLCQQLDKMTEQRDTAIGIANKEITSLHTEIEQLKNKVKALQSHKPHCDECGALLIMICPVHDDNRAELQADNESLCTALKEIAKGEGRFDLDQLRHCKNTVEDMKEIAKKALPDTEAK